jgi:peroxiredoxin
MNRTRLALVRPLLASALVFGLASAAQAAPETTGPKPGEAAPDFSLTAHDGRAVKLADLKGKVVVLEWTNPGCPFVARHYKANTMELLEKTWKGKEVVWLAINSSHFADAAANKAFVEAEQLAYPVLDDHAGTVGHAYGARTTPDMYVIAPDGKIAYRGAIDDDPHGDKAGATNLVDSALKAQFAGKAPEPSLTQPYGCSIKYAKN